MGNRTSQPMESVSFIIDRILLVENGSPEITVGVATKGIGLFGKQAFRISNKMYWIVDATDEPSGIEYKLTDNYKITFYKTDKPYVSYGPHGQAKIVPLDRAVVEFWKPIGMESEEIDRIGRVLA
jgi:hypothetical protein